MGKAKPARGAKAQREDRPRKRNQRVRIFLLIVNQVVTKKLRKNCKKIWWIGKVVVTLQGV